MMKSSGVHDQLRSVACLAAGGSPATASTGCSFVWGSG